MKDSRQIVDDDRKRMLKEIEKTDVRRVVVTHGTYTMPITAKYLKKFLGKTSKTIVLAGSMVPINGFDFSDGPFNLGFAIAQTQVLQPGVYLAMNARVFKPEEVEKDTKKGVFYSVFEEKQ